MTAAPRSVSRNAPAKLNVFLRVLGARDDGYHELESLVLPLSLADRVTVTEARKLDVIVGAEVDLSEGLEAGGMNLALVAALAMAEACGGPMRGAEIRIDETHPGRGRTRRWQRRRGRDAARVERAVGVRPGPRRAAGDRRADRLRRPGDAGRRPGR